MEAAGCLWLEPGQGELTLEEGAGDGAPTEIRRSAGETFACEPLAALGLLRRRPAGLAPLAVGAEWCGARARLTWGPPARALSEAGAEVGGEAGE